MLRTALALLVALCASPASAEDCPDFYRFVDFGLEGRDGVLYRGGPIFRIESFAGDLIVDPAQTTCLTVPQLAADGHGNPIPVAGQIGYDTAAAGLDLTTLTVRVTDGTDAITSQSSDVHRARLNAPDTQITSGENILCAQTATQLSCQLTPPYPGNRALVIYCDTATCTMPALAFDARLLITASWPSSAALIAAPDITGPAFLTRVEAIRAFIEEMT